MKSNLNLILRRGRSAGRVRNEDTGGRLATLAASQTIREYAQGVAVENINPVAEYLAPTVPVGTVAGDYSVWDSKNRFTIPETRRAIDGEAVKIKFGKTKKKFNVEPHAIDCPVDVMESAALDDEDLTASLQEAADISAQVAGLAHERDVINLVNETGTVVNVKMEADVDPIDQLDKYILEVAKGGLFGSLMNIRILSGTGSTIKLKQHPLLKNRLVLGLGKGVSAPVGAVDEPFISGLLLAKPEIRTSFLAINQAPEGKDAKIEYLLDNKLIILAAMDQPTRLDPSAFKTFRLRNRYMVPGMYERPDGRGSVAKYDWSEQIVAANTAACIIVNWT